MMDLCLFVAGTALWLRSAGPVTLAWEHSVERFAIEERYRADEAGVRLAEVGLRGVGAGVDVPVQAELVQGWWRFVPAAESVPAVQLANSAGASGYRVCADGRCRQLPAGSGQAAVLRACPPG